VKPWWS